LIKYLGSKRTLLPVITGLIGELPGTRTVVDLFSGTSRVGHALKRAGYRVLANDHNRYASTLARCYVEADAEDVAEPAQRLIDELNTLPGRAGYFTDMFCVRSRYIQPRNGERIDAIRGAIAAKGLEPELEAVLLVSLMEAADRVDSTAGLQMAFLKSWSARSHHELRLRMPRVLPRAAAGRGEAHELDAADAAEQLTGDVVYIDPPYNQHSYLGNYHVWETLVRWDNPSVYGIACKRDDCRTRRSAFNSRTGFEPALRAVLERVRAGAVVVSFSDEGSMSPERMLAILGSLWGGAARVRTSANDYPRYIGSQIGIYNPRGERVGKAGPKRNTEFIAVATREPAVHSGHGPIRGLPGVPIEDEPPHPR
jgi:adenine-specific DNA-methyltransferase